MFDQHLIFVYLELRSILMLCEQAKIGEDEMLTEYLLFIDSYSAANTGVTGT